MLRIVGDMTSVTLFQRTSVVRAKHCFSIPLTYAQHFLGKGKIICFEPLTLLKERNSGVEDVKPAKMEEDRLMYEKDIRPGACRYIASAIRENIGSISFVERMLSLLHGLPFNNKCNSHEYAQHKWPLVFIIQIYIYR